MRHAIPATNISSWHYRIDCLLRPMIHPIGQCRKWFHENLLNRQTQSTLEKLHFARKCWHQVVSSLMLSILVLFILPVSNVHAQAETIAAVSIGSALDGLRNIVKQLESSASFLISQGNNSLAQQQMLLAGILTSLIEQTRVAYADSLNKTFSQLNVAEQNAFNDLFETTKQFGALEKQSSKDIQAIVYRTQGAANQIMNRIPLVKRTPVFYGVIVRDLVADQAQNPADLEILGFLFSDDRLNYKKPRIKVADQSIDEKLVSIQEDRIQVQLPDQLKTKVGFGAGACTPRKTFPIAIDVFYGVPRGFWPIQWNSEKEVGFNANALAGADRFDVAITEDGTRTDVSQKTETFSTRSGNVQVGCEDGGNGAVRFALPSDGTEINCSAAWVNTSNLKNTTQSACTVGGTIASATGTIRGLDRDCVPIVGGILRTFTGSYSCNCRGGGNGYLQISGNYKIPVTKVNAFSNADAGKYIMTNGHLNATIGSDSAVKKSKVTVAINRVNCSSTFDRIVMNLPDNPLLGVTQSSASGLFNAALRNGQLTIGSVSE